MPLLGPVVQIAYVVDDARLAAAAMVERYGAGPFHVIDRIELAWGELRGEPCPFLHTSAYGQWGEVMMELVEPIGDGPSPFFEGRRPGEGGIHHVATIVDDLADTYRRLAEDGVELAARAETTGGTEFAFVDTLDTLGHFVEIYEGTPGLRGFYQLVRSAAEGWDGTDPVRTL